ncbi:MAG: putative type molybdate transport system, periplasmic component [Ramlibacter sp.]|jgi:molybdate transport system substrate-binding protein|uniref:molybdate ABC transporter substrate-binding protein n=1 Tax=Ramlibacter sp. TaxID=1917967 RepID=UPI00260E5DAB|nr:molybdate ABC transporter substrate-binding protein [Ramlibacter sp.]MDB5751881.1 putative type molybdate transport system, periplasmic component [Ramlibacter sp.]
MRIPRRLLLLLPLAAVPPARAGQVRVAVAANLVQAMQEITRGFAQASGHQAQLVPGSTGKFYAQIRNGAPFEVLLAADQETPARLEGQGLAVTGTRFTYATGRLALWSARPGLVDGDAVLRRPPAGPLAIADPRVAPYGAAARQVLQRLGLLAAWQPHLVQGESIGQAFQFVASGNAPLGFVALAQVMAGGRLTSGSAWTVPARLHQPLRQDAVLLAGGRGNPAAEALLQYLRGDAARAVLRAHGYQV